MELNDKVIEFLKEIDEAEQRDLNLTMTKR